LVDACPGTIELLRHLVSVAMPEVTLSVWKVDNGCPDAEDLTSFDAVLLDGRVALEATTTGMNWLDRLRAQKSMPPVMVLTAAVPSEMPGSVELRRTVAEPMRLSRADMAASVFAKKVRSVWLASDNDISRSTPTAVIVPARAQVMVSRHRKAAPTEKPAKKEALQVDVPGFEVLERVGRGGMATVYRAQSVDAGHDVILKVVSVDGDVVLRRFLREFQLAAQLDHRNIVQIYERGFSAEYAYISMEFCAGGDLSGRIRAGMDENEAVRVVSQVASALAEAHQCGVIHRDVKPANVLFRADNSVALSDFGIAKAREAGASLTMTNAMVGTPHYLSPEQVRAARIDHRADLYGLGVLFFEMLTGRRPFEADRLVRLLEAHVSADIPALPLDVALYQPIIDKLLAKQPEERYQNADELLEALSTYL